MSVPWPVVTSLQCPKIAILDGLIRSNWFIFIMIFKSVRLDAVMSGVSSEFPGNSFWSIFWTTLFEPRPDDPVVGGWPHGHFNFWYNHTIHCRQNHGLNFRQQQQHYPPLFFLCRQYFLQWPDYDYSYFPEVLRASNYW